MCTKYFQKSSFKPVSCALVAIKSRVKSIQRTSNWQTVASSPPIPPEPCNSSSATPKSTMNCSPRWSGGKCWGDKVIYHCSHTGLSKPSLARNEAMCYGILFVQGREVAFKCRHDRLTRCSNRCQRDSPHPSNVAHR